MKIKCIKSLYKSTYRKNAFSRGRLYEIVLQDDFVWIKDNEGHDFNFAREVDNSSYVLSEYFHIPGV